MKERVVVVTGANKGLGFAMVRSLCHDLGRQAHVYLTARDTGRGQAAVARLEAEGLAPLFFQLDLRSPASITALADHLRAQHGGVDLLIQNAAYAVAPGVPGKDQVRLLIETNNVGTHNVLRAFRALLRPEARVVVVASGFGTLRSLDARLHDRFDTDRMTIKDLERALDEYVLAVEAGRDVAAGWPEWINVPSKVGQVAAMRIFARDVARENAGVLVNAVCPGWMITDASRPYLKDLPPTVTPKGPEDAVDDALWPGLLPPGSTGPMGELVQYRAILPWK
jgi:carbonyl reductase 1